MTNFLIVFHVCVFSLGVFLDDISGESVFVMEGDSVALHTDVKTNQHEKIKWFFNDTRIAQVTGDLSKTCTDVQCNEGTERFRDRLKLDHQNGSLTILNTRTTDSGLYQLQIISNNSINEKIFRVTVNGVPAAKRNEIHRKSLKEGESVTLDPGDINKDDVMKWYFNDIVIAEITGDQSKICEDVQCKERFRDRLKLNQTGSLIITNTRNTDSGLYKLKIINRGFIIHRHRSISIISDNNFSVPDWSVLIFVIIGICVAALLLVLTGLIDPSLHLSSSLPKPDRMNRPEWNSADRRQCWMPVPAASRAGVPVPAASRAGVPVPAASRAGVPEPAAVGVPEPAAVGVPEPAAVSVPEPAAVSVPEPAAVSVPEPAARSAGVPEPAKKRVVFKSAVVRAEERAAADSAAKTLVQSVSSRKRYGRRKSRIPKQ